MLGISSKHYFVMEVAFKYLIGSGYLRILDRICQAFKKLEVVGRQPIKILLRRTPSQPMRMPRADKPSV